MRGCSVLDVVRGDALALRLDVHAMRCATMGRCDGVSETLQRADKDGMGVDVVIGLLARMAGRVD